MASSTGCSEDAATTVQDLNNLFPSYDAGGFGDGSLGDGSFGDGSLGDGSLGDGSFGDGSLGDGSAADGNLGDGSSEDAGTDEDGSSVPDAGEPDTDAGTFEPPPVSGGAWTLNSDSAPECPPEPPPIPIIGGACLGIYYSCGWTNEAGQVYSCICDWVHWLCI